MCRWVLNWLLMFHYRISERNLGRDNRVIGDHMRDCVAPYLDENFVSYVNSLPVQYKVCFSILLYLTDLRTFVYWSLIKSTYFKSFISSTSGFKSTIRLRHGGVSHFNRGTLNNAQISLIRLISPYPVDKERRWYCGKWLKIWDWAAAVSYPRKRYSSAARSLNWRREGRKVAMSAHDSLKKDCLSLYHKSDQTEMRDGQIWCDLNFQVFVFENGLVFMMTRVVTTWPCLLW